MRAANSPRLRPVARLSDELEAVDCDRRAIATPLPKDAVGRAGRSTVVLAASSTGAFSRRVAALEPAARLRIAQRRGASELAPFPLTPTG